MSISSENKFSILNDYDEESISILSNNNQALNESWTDTMDGVDPITEDDHAKMNSKFFNPVLNDVLLNKPLNNEESFYSTSLNDCSDKLASPKLLIPQFTPDNMDIPSNLSSPSHNNSSNNTSWNPAITISPISSESNLSFRNSIKIMRELNALDQSLAPQQIQLIKGKIIINCTNQKQQTNLLQCVTLEGKHVKCTIGNLLKPVYTGYFQVIIHGVDTEIDIDDITSETGAENARRLMKKDNDSSSLIPTTSVVLGFKESPPSRIALGFKMFKATTFIPRPYRCNKCQSFNHIEKFCKSKLSCPLCAKEHRYSDCPIKHESNPTYFCKNCKKDHSAGFRGCVSYLEAQEIVKIRTNHRISYADAAKLHKSMPIESVITRNVTSVNLVSHDVSRMTQFPLPYSAGKQGNNCIASNTVKVCRDSECQTTPDHFNHSFKESISCKNSSAAADGFTNLNFTPSQYLVLPSSENYSFSTPKSRAAFNMSTQKLDEAHCSSCSTDVHTDVHTNTSIEENLENNKGDNKNNDKESLSDTLVQFIKNLNNDQIFNMLSLVLKWFLTNTSVQSSPTNTQTLNNSGISSILPILLEVLTTNNNTNSI